MTSVLVASLLAVALAADAPETAPEPAVPDPKWEGVNRRATRTANAGVITNLAGVGFMAAGAGMVRRHSWYDEGSVGIRAGATLGLIGTPLAAAGSLRARKAVIGMGHPAPSAGWGVGTWCTILPLAAGTAGGAWLMTEPLIQDYIEEDQVAAWLLPPLAGLVVVQGGAAAMARVQLARNRRAMGGVALVPTWSRPAPGLALSGAW